MLSRHRAEIDRGLGASILPFMLEDLDVHLGGPWEQTFRDHLRRACASGTIADGVVALGPWWRHDGQNEIDAVALAGRRREVVLVGEAKWGRSADGRRLRRALERKAASVSERPEDLTYAIAARDNVTNPPAGTVVVTAADVFRPT